MTDELALTGNHSELALTGDRGECRLPNERLASMSPARLAALESAVAHAIATTKGLEVSVTNDLLTNSVVVRWRTRG